MHVLLTFQRSFQKTIVNCRQLQSRFPAHKGKFSLSSFSSPKGEDYARLQEPERYKYANLFNNCKTKEFCRARVALTRSHISLPCIAKNTKQNQKKKK